MGSWAKRSSAAVLVIACGGSAQTAVTPAGMSNADTTEGLASFAFDSLDTRPVTSNAFRGKPAVLAFVTATGAENVMRSAYPPGTLRSFSVIDVVVND